MSLSGVAATWAMDAGRWSRFHSISIVHHHRQSSAQPSPSRSLHKALTSAPLPKVSQEAYFQNIVSSSIFLHVKFRNNYFWINNGVCIVLFPCFIKAIIDIEATLVSDTYYWNRSAQRLVQGKGGTWPTCPDSRRTWECEHLTSVTSHTQHSPRINAYQSIL